jgi:hypothetical protein
MLCVAVPDHTEEVKADPGSKGRELPYEIMITKRVEITDREKYINECCVGGDLIVERLLPAVKERYPGAGLQTEQEDWGWFIWFQGRECKLAIDVFTDVPDAGQFRIHLTSRKRGWLFFRVEDTKELEDLRGLVETRLAGWTDAPPKIERLDKNYM